MIADFRQPALSLDEEEYAPTANVAGICYLHCQVSRVVPQRAVGLRLHYQGDHRFAEHKSGPRRLQLPFFNTCTTYRATNLSPAWLAFYDIENVSVLSDLSYLALPEIHSKREVKVIHHVAHMQRKAGFLVSTKGSFSKDASVLVWVEMSLKDMIDEKE